MILFSDLKFDRELVGRLAAQTLTTADGYAIGVYYFNTFSPSPRGPFGVTVYGTSTRQTIGWMMREWTNLEPLDVQCLLHELMTKGLHHERAEDQLEGREP